MPSGSVPRELFLPAAMQNAAYADAAVALGRGRCIMEPRVFGRLLQMADITATSRVLVVGGGSGYSTAVFSRLAQSVVMVESDTQFATQARENLAQLQSPAQVFTAALTVGQPAQAPYDVIFIDGAVQQVPQSLQNQLAPGGRIITVLNAAGGFAGKSGLGRAYNHAPPDG